MAHTPPEPRTLPAGVGAALLAAVLFGASTPFAKLLLGEARVTPQLLAGLLYLGSGVGLCLVVASLRLWALAPKLRVKVNGAGTRSAEHGARSTERSEHGAQSRLSEAPLTRADLPWLAGAVFFGGVLGPVLLMFGLAVTAASSASLLLNLEGVFTALLAWFAFRENFDRRILMGMLLIVAGGVLLSWQGPLGAGDEGAIPFLGPLAVAGACLCWGIDNNLTQKVSAGDPIQVAAIKGGAAGAVNLGVALSLGAGIPALPAVGGAMLVGFLGYGVSLVLFVLALRHIGTARSGAYFSIAPFVGAVVALLLLREPIGPLFLAAAALMAAGVWLHLTERHEHEHTHEPIAHSHRHVHDEHHRHDHAPGTDPTEPHTHWHVHERLTHRHPHFPDIHHRHEHAG